MIRFRFLTILAICLMCAGHVLGDEFDPFVAKSNAVRNTDWNVATAEAIKENKPLFVWIRYNCPSTSNQIDGAVHVFLDSFKGDSTQRVVTCMPDGSGWLVMNPAATAPADVCANNLRRSLESLKMMRASPPTFQMQTGGWQTQSRRSVVMPLFSAGRHGDCAT